jgi:hypothetical protein
MNPQGTRRYGPEARDPQDSSILNQTHSGPGLAAFIRGLHLRQVRER